MAIFELYIADSLNIIGLSGDPEGLFSIGLVKTTDAGLSWNFEEIGIFGVVFAIKFRTSLEGWAAAGEKLLYSPDGGDSWSEMLTPDSRLIFDICFPHTSYGTQLKPPLVPPLLKGGNLEGSLLI